MRLAPDLSSYVDELPDLEELLPEEVQYLCDVCRMLNALRICGGQRSTAETEELFDADELGLDPEEDNCRS